MINKTYDEFIKNTADISALAFEGREAVTIVREGMPDLILVSADLLNEQVSDLVDSTAIEAAERSERAGLKMLSEEEIWERLKEKHINAEAQSRISS